MRQRPPHKAKQLGDARAVGPGRGPLGAIGQYLPRVTAGTLGHRAHAAGVECRRNQAGDAGLAPGAVDQYAHGDAPQAAYMRRPLGQAGQHQRHQRD